MPSQKCGKGCPGALMSMTIGDGAAADCACALGDRQATHKRTALASTGARETLIAVLGSKREPGREASRCAPAQSMQLEAEPRLEFHDPSRICIRRLAELPRVQDVGRRRRRDQAGEVQDIQYVESVGAEFD